MIITADGYSIYQRRGTIVIGLPDDDRLTVAELRSLLRTVEKIRGEDDGDD